jgi:CMP-N-acetylneuraminic acid synthetase
MVCCTLVKEFIRKGKIFLKIVYLINHIFASADIDTLQDLQYAEYLYQKNL